MATTEITQNINHENFPQAISELSNKIDDLVRLTLEQNKKNHPEGEIVWFDINKLCDYLPEKPVKATVYLMVSRREIPFRKRSKKLFFLKSEIDDYLKKGRYKTAAERVDEISDSLQNRKRR